MPVSIIERLTDGALGGRIDDLESLQGHFVHAGTPFVTTDTATHARYDGPGARDLEDQFKHVAHSTSD